MHYVKFNYSVIILCILISKNVSKKMFKKRHGLYRYNSILWGKIGQFGLITKPFLYNLLSKFICQSYSRRENCSAFNFN